MDNQHDLRQHADYVTDDAAVEAPPKIGGDERRMHVRAYNYWLSLLDGNDFPSVEDLDPENISDFGPHSLLLDFTAGSENPAISYIGDKLRTECDLDVEILSIGDVPPRTLISRLTDHYMQIIANRAPVGFEAEFTNQRGLDMAYRGILMPFSSDNDTIDFIYGVINWKEVVVGDLAATLQGEVDRVLSEARITTVPQVPAWADGPSRQSSVQLPQREADHEIVSAGTAHHDELFDGPSDDLAEMLTPTGADALADWLAAAREAAEVAHSLDNRSRGVLYRAIGLAYDFALIADARPDDYAELLADCGLTVQARAPMTPIVKLVFGTTYDKTRLTEYASALAFAKSQGLPSGELATYLESFDGGLKGMLKAARAAKRPAKMAVPRQNNSRERARTLDAQAIFAVPGDDEFVILVARRMDGEHVGVIGVAELDEVLIDRALHRIAL